jgi:hypothetical protein
MRVPKLGLAGQKRDPRGRTLQLRDFLKRDFAYPAACDLAMAYPDGDDLGNNSVGCCAVAGPAHFVRWEDAFCNRRPRVWTADVLREYAALSGWSADVPGSDVGCFALDVMKRWRSAGLFGTKIEAFAQVNFFDVDELAKAIFLLGGVFLCFALPRSVRGADTWDVVDKDGGSWGNHLVWADGTGLVNSWGQRIRVTSAFVERYAFDCYAVVSGDAIEPSGHAFSGLDLSGLAVALEEVTG